MLERSHHRRGRAAERINDRVADKRKHLDQPRGQFERIAGQEQAAGQAPALRRLLRYREPPDGCRGGG